MTGKTALITGASSGLGAHFAQVLAGAGANVVVAARRQERLAQLVAEISSQGGQAQAVSLDVTSIDSVTAAVSAAEAAFGRIDVLINNAGIADPQRFLETQQDTWQKVIDVNLSGVFRVGQAVAQRMAAAGSGGAIVNLASVLGFRVQSHQAAYSTSKAGVVSLTQSMAAELGRERIRVNAIAPGYFLTEINAQFLATEDGEKFIGRLFPRRVGELHELDGALLLLASDAGSYINGTTILVDGGTALKAL